jgi:uncharacterized membrane protein YccC
MEVLLNIVWMLVAVSAFMLAPRRSMRALAALGIVLVLLFPIISVSDDLSADREILDEAFAVIVACFALLVGLVAVARLESRVERPALVFIPASADPRSPPRA